MELKVTDDEAAARAEALKRAHRDADVNPLADGNRASRRALAAALRRQGVAETRV